MIMKQIEIITHDYPTELAWLRDNISTIDSCLASFVPKHKGKVQVQIANGSIRQYSGELARKVFNYLH